jgi:uncharacterized membrane protein
VLFEQASSESHVCDDEYTDMKLYFNTEDASQIAIGAFAMAMPIAFTQEAWDMALTLPWLNLLLFAVLSICFLSFYAYYSLFQGAVKNRVRSYVVRVGLAYAITLLVVALVLLALDKLPIMDDPMVAFRRLIIVSMPASIGAIIVESFDKE